MTARRWSWVALVLVAAGALVVGATGDGGPRTSAERVEHISSRLRCPTCQGLSVRDSDAPAARTLRTEITRRVSEGQTDSQIIDYVVSRYDEGVLLDPPKEGFSLLVWVLPAAAAVSALAGLAMAFRRWRPRGQGGPSDEDRELVARARAGGPHDGSNPGG